VFWVMLPYWIFAFRCQQVKNLEIQYLIGKHGCLSHYIFDQKISEFRKILVVWSEALYFLY
jgi:hypothetical protein